MEQKKILVIEDEEVLQKIILKHLKKENFLILQALDGAEGLKIAREQKVDLIVLDIILPKMDGFMVCRLLKFDGKYKHIPIIILSSRTQEKDKTLCFELGADAYLAKPYDPDVLLAKIHELLAE